MYLISGFPPLETAPGKRKKAAKGSLPKPDAKLREEKQSAG
jgi:hypothetical protein